MDPTIAATSRRPVDRPATPACWQAALDRAQRQHVTIFRDSGDERFAFWIAQGDAGKPVYMSVVDGTPDSCDCMASGYGDPICLHKAAYLAATGQLDALGLEAASALNVTQFTQPMECGACHGRGQLIYPDARRPHDWTPTTCRTCHGTGQVETLITTLAA